MRITNGPDDSPRVVARHPGTQVLQLLTRLAMIRDVIAVDKI